MPNATEPAAQGNDVKGAAAGYIFATIDEALGKAETALAETALAETAQSAQPETSKEAATSDDARDALKTTDGDDAKRVHDIRVATKRLRAVWRLARPTTGEQAYRDGDERLKAVSNDLASQRDQVVMLKTLKRLRKDAGKKKTRRAVKRVTRRLESVNGSPRDQSPPWQPVRDRLQRERDEWAAQLPAFLSESALSEGVVASYRKTRRAARRAAEGDTAEAYHDWRKATKRLLYQVELLQAAGVKSLNKLHARLKKLASQLGRLNDLHVLEVALAGLASGALQSGDPSKNSDDTAKNRDNAADIDKSIARVRRLIDRATAELRKGCRREAKRVFALPPKKLRRRLNKQLPVAPSEATLGAEDESQELRLAQ